MKKRFLVFAGIIALLVALIHLPPDMQWARRVVMVAMLILLFRFAFMWKIRK